MRSSKRSRWRALWTDVRGVYQTEYTVVLVLVALVAAVAIAALAVPLIEHHDAVLRILETPLS